MNSEVEVEVEVEEYILFIEAVEDYFISQDKECISGALFMVCISDETFKVVKGYGIDWHTEAGLQKVFEIGKGFRDGNTSLFTGA